jgi:hypothetical protein
MTARPPLRSRRIIRVALVGVLAVGGWLTGRATREALPAAPAAGAPAPAGAESRAAVARAHRRGDRGR